jgi:hypothetical protein
VRSTSLSSPVGLRKLTTFDLHRSLLHHPTHRSTPCPAPALGDPRLYIGVFQASLSKRRRADTRPGRGSITYRRIASPAWSTRVLTAKRSSWLLYGPTTRSGWATQNIVCALYIFLLFHTNVALDQKSQTSRALRALVLPPTLPLLLPPPNRTRHSFATTVPPGGAPATQPRLLAQARHRPVRRGSSPPRMRTDLRPRHRAGRRWGRGHARAAQQAHGELRGTRRGPAAASTPPTSPPASSYRALPDAPPSPAA